MLLRPANENRQKQSVRIKKPLHENSTNKEAKWKIKTIKYSLLCSFPFLFSALLYFLLDFILMIALLLNETLNEVKKRITDTNNKTVVS